MSLTNKDYRQFEKTLVKYLDTKEDGNIIKNVKAISDTIENIQDLIDSKNFLKEHIKDNICIEDLSVSNKYYYKFCCIVDDVKTKKDLLKYVFNIWLAGQGLSTSRLR